jgi:hypothetical protein
MSEPRKTWRLLDGGGQVSYHRSRKDALEYLARQREYNRRIRQPGWVESLQRLDLDTIDADNPGEWYTVERIVV